MKRNAFTIIEMAIVLLIALIIIAITAGAYARIGSGARLDSTVQMVGSELLRARQQAMADRRIVAVLFPGPGSGLANEKKYSCFRVAYAKVSTTNPNDLDFDGYPEDSKWNFCHPGITVMETDSDVGIRDSSGVRLDPQDEEYVKYKAGTLPGYGINRVDLTDIGGAASENHVRAVVFIPSGRLYSAVTLHVTIGEANFNAGQWMYSPVSTMAGNISVANQMTIFVNCYTGGLRYVRPENYP